ncbi:MAG: dTDP-4-dehydrorhamnose 3,5-epimerase [Pseudorhizobium sp.]
MNIEQTAFPGVFKITLKRFDDSRGYFWELYREEEFRAQICDLRFVQDNRSLSWQEGTVRGLHFQRHPNAQGKLVQVLSGAIFDVALDIRPTSPTFGRWIGIELTDENDTQLWIPTGFAHGFMTLKARTVVHYKTTAPYRPHDEGGILWNDPDIAIEWPMAEGKVKVSDKDALQPRLRDLPIASLAAAELSA